MSAVVRDERRNVLRALDRDQLVLDDVAEAGCVTVQRRKLRISDYVESGSQDLDLRPHRFDLAAHDAYEHWRATKRDTLGRVLKGNSKPFVLPAAPEGQINLSDPARG